VCDVIELQNIEDANEVIEYFERNGQIRGPHAVSKAGTGLLDLQNAADDRAGNPEVDSQSFDVETSAL